MKPILSRYIRRAFAPEIVKNSNFVKRLWIFSHPRVISIDPVITKGTRSRKKVCCVCGKSSDFTKTPLSHQITQAQRIARKGSILLFFIVFFIIFIYSTALQIHHASILASEFQEFPVCSTFNNFSLFQHYDVIGRFYCLKSMRDDYDRASLKEVFKSLCYFFFTIAIKCCCGLIEEYDFWIFEKYLCYSETLFLSSR